jgi:BirA family biotin operon repressor/biotin-[acetyl-CoA-carboxylase] ligase
MTADIPLSFSISRLDSIPSTNDHVLERIRREEARPGEVVVARSQPGARGRQGRRWIAAEGGLWFTAAMPLGGTAVGWAGILAALAVCQGLDGLGLRAGVKWPNDVVAGGRKLAGVLVETVAGCELAAVGVGLNVANPLPPVESAMRSGVFPPTSVCRELGREIDPQELLAPILARLGELWGSWSAGRTEALREAWADRDACRGRRVRLLPAGPVGVADGIDETGALRVRLPDGRAHLALAGELSFLE